MYFKKIAKKEDIESEAQNKIVHKVMMPALREDSKKIRSKNNSIDKISHEAMSSILKSAYNRKVEAVPGKNKNKQAQASVPAKTAAAEAAYRKRMDDLIRSISKRG
jgi:hypothetical protein